MGGTYDALPWARRVPLKANQKALVYALVSYLDEDDECFPGQEVLAEGSGMDERSVRRHLAEMEAAGIITRRARMRADGRGRTSDRIRVHVGWLVSSFEACPRCRGEGELGTVGADELCSHPWHDLPDKLSGRSEGDQPDRSDDQPDRSDRTNRTRVSGEVPEEPPEEGSKGDEGVAASGADVEVVWVGWLAATGKSATRTRLDDRRRRLIRRALRDYPIDEVLAAVRGWRYSAHHRGDGGGKAYNDLGLLLRDAEHVEQFRDMAWQAEGGRPPGSTLDLDGDPPERPPLTGRDAIAARNRRRAEGEACPDCDDLGIVLGDDDVARPCSTCRRAG